MGQCLLAHITSEENTGRGSGLLGTSFGVLSPFSEKPLSDTETTLSLKQNFHIIFLCNTKPEDVSNALIWTKSKWVHHLLKASWRFNIGLDYLTKGWIIISRNIYLSGDYSRNVTRFSSLLWLAIPCVNKHIYWAPGYVIVE